MLPAAQFSPSNAQRRLLKQIVAQPSFQTVAEICQAANVDPSSYYKWCHDLEFRRWLMREWSGALVFEGWHMLNLARANMCRSATHFRALFSLIFDAKGQQALQSWQETVTDATFDVECLRQQYTRQNEKVGMRGTAWEGGPAWADCAAFCGRIA